MNEEQKAKNIRNKNAIMMIDGDKKIGTKKRKRKIAKKKLAQKQ
jgi:hypothetical protein